MFQEKLLEAMSAARLANRRAIEAAGYEVPPRAVIQAGDMLDLEAYARGYEAALQTIAAAFGVDGYDPQS